MFSQHSLVSEIPSLQKFAFHLTRNKADADDLVQSTCLRALEKMHYFKEDTNLLSWTSKIMFNLFVSGYRRKIKFESKLDPNVILRNISIAPTQEFSLEFANTKKAMARLTRPHREILILICIQGLLYKEASEILQIPVGTVRSRLARARKNLQHIVEHPQTNTSDPSQKRHYKRAKNDNLQFLLSNESAFPSSERINQKLTYEMSGRESNLS